MKKFKNIVRAKRIPAETAAALGLTEIKGENRLEVRNESGKKPKIMILGSIGKSWWDDSGISEQEVRDALSTIPDGTDFELEINSEGGSVKEGLGIYNAIKARRANAVCRVGGYALSIASVIPLAAGKVVSPKSAIWMTHKAWSWATGNADDMAKQVDMLNEHDQTLAEIYASETGKTKDEWLSLMTAETWIRGSKAVEFGLADEGDDEDQDDTQAAAHPPIHASYLSRCKNAAPEILNAINARTLAALQTISAPLSGAARDDKNPTAPNTGAGTDTNIMNKAQMLALLNKWGVRVPDNASDAEILALVEAGKPETKTASTGAPVAAATQTESPEVVALRESIKTINAQLEREKTDRITRAVDALVGETRLTVEERPAALARALKDETYLAELQARPVASFGASGLGASVQILSENPLEKVFAEKDPGKRHAILAADWDSLVADAMARDARGDKCRVKSPHFKGNGGMPVAANTYSATLVTSFLGDGATTVLQHQLAGLDCFSKDWSTDRYKPMATGVLKKVTAASTTQTDATDFESGNSTVDPVSVTVHQYSQSFQVSNSDLNNGLRMQDLVEINAAAFGNKLMQIATAPITEAIFASPAPQTFAPAAFGWGDMATLWGLLKKASFKNAILDGEYIGQLNNTPTFFQNSGIGGSAAMNFGWNKIALNTDWTGAGAGIRGFACHPQAIGTVIGLPLTPTNVGQQIPGATLSEATFQVPGLNITVALYVWFSLGSRTLWSSYDIILGAKELDTTAGVIIKA